MNKSLKGMEKKLANQILSGFAKYGIDSVSFGDKTITKVDNDIVETTKSRKKSK